MTNTFKLIGILLLAFIYNSCQEETTLLEKEDVSAIEIISSIQDSVEIGGALLHSPSEYENIQVLKVDNVQSLANENESETRVSYNRINHPNVANQGKEGSCVAFAVGFGAMSYYLNNLFKLPYTINGAYRSPEFLYNNTKISGDCLTGSYIDVALNFIQVNGVCNWATMPYNDTNCSFKGHATQWTQASKHKLKKWGRITNTTTNIKAFSDKKYPIIVAFNLDEKFFTQTKYWPYTYKSKGGKVVAGHAMMIVGYDDAKQAFIVQNSWGTSNHDKGFLYITYSMMNKLYPELYVIHPQI